MKIPLCAPPADDDAIRDQILKLFSQSSSDTETHRERAMCYLRDVLENRNVSARRSLDDTRREIDGASEDNSPMPVSEYLKFLGRKIIPQSSNMSPPRCIRHTTSVVPGFVWALGDLIVRLNQNLVKRDASRAYLAGKKSWPASTRLSTAGVTISTVPRLRLTRAPWVL